MAETKPYRTGRAVRDAKRRMRAHRLRVAYRNTGDHRKLKRARRIEAQLNRDMSRQLNDHIRGAQAAFAAGIPAIRRAVDRISEAFAKVRTQTNPDLIAAAQAKGREAAEKIAAYAKAQQPAPIVAPPRIPRKEKGFG